LLSSPEHNKPRGIKEIDLPNNFTLFAIMEHREIKAPNGGFISLSTNKPFIKNTLRVNAEE
jgi:hypothetical protein